MNRIKLHAMVVIGCAVVMSLLGGSSRASCPAPPSGPICSARAGLFCSNADTTPCNTDANCPGGVCNVAVIFGTPDPNGANVTSITTDSVHLLISTSGLNTPAATFRVHWDAFGSSFAGNVTATNANGSCTVPVRFSSRGAGVPTYEVICSNATYTFAVIGGPSSPAGQNACAIYPYTCADGGPPTDSVAPGPLLDFPAGTVVFSVASPIHSVTLRDVTMDLAGGGGGRKVRLAFARSVDSGSTYSAFTDSTTAVVPDPRIIGTGDWSSIRVAVAVSTLDFPVSTFPSLSAWGRVLLALVMLAAVIWFSWRYATTSRQVSRHP